LVHIVDAGGLSSTGWWTTGSRFQRSGFRVQGPAFTIDEAWCGRGRLGARTGPRRTAREAATACVSVRDVRPPWMVD